MTVTVEQMTDTKPSINEIIGGSVYIPRKENIQTDSARVLLIEDDRKLSIALGIRLKSCGYVVCLCTDSETALKEAVEFKPDIVVIDINLPGGDGFTLTERMKSVSQLSDIPFVFITASKSPGLLEKAIESGAIGYLEKPFYSTELTELIESCAP